MSRGIKCRGCWVDMDLLGAVWRGREDGEVDLGTEYGKIEYGK